MQIRTFHSSLNTALSAGAAEYTNCTFAEG